MTFRTFYKPWINEIIISFSSNGYSLSYVSSTNLHTFPTCNVDMRHIMLLCNCIHLSNGIAFDLLMLLLNILYFSLNISFAIAKSFFLKICAIFWITQIGIFKDISHAIYLGGMNKMQYRIWYSRGDHCKLKDRVHISFHLLWSLQGLNKSSKIYLSYLLLNFHRNLIKLRLEDILINSFMVVNQI